MLLWSVDVSKSDMSAEKRGGVLLKISMDAFARTATTFCGDAIGETEINDTLLLNSGQILI